MLSIKRLVCVVLITLCISAIFLIINYQETSHNVVDVKNDACGIEALEHGDTLPLESDPRLVLVSAEEDAVWRNIKDLLEGWKLPWEQSARVYKFDPAFETVYIFCQDQIAPVADLQELVSYVQNGGKVVLAAGIAEGNAESYLHSMLGIASRSARLETGTFSFSDGFLPFQEEKMAYDGYNSSTWLSLQERARVYVTDAEHDTPVVYSYPYGEGCAMVINGTLLSDPRCMGILTGLLSNELSGFLYPVLDARLVFLDNFPIVTYVADDVCMRSYGRKTDDFVENVVWPVFQGIAVQNEIRYTSCVLTLSREDSFFPELQDSIFYAMGKSALVYGGELVEGADFSGSGDMIRNEAFDAKFEKFFPNYEIRGLAALNGKDTEAAAGLLPDVTVTRGYLCGDENTMLLCRAEHTESGYFFPLISDGLDLESGNLFTVAMAAAAQGVFSQRIDMNRVILNEEKQPIWDEQRQLIGEYQDRCFSRLDWLEALTLSETASRINGLENLRYTFEPVQGGFQLSCETFRPGQAFLFHWDKKVSVEEGGELQRLNGDYYLLRIDQPTVRLRTDG